MRCLMLLLCLSAASRADFIMPTIGTYGFDRATTPNPLSTFVAWETFASTTGTPPSVPQTVFGAGTGNPSTLTTTNFNGFGGPAGSTWAPANLSGIANVYDAGAPGNGAFLTGGGNIYSPTGVVEPRITFGSNADNTLGNLAIGTTNVLVQIRGFGADIDLASVRLYDPVSGTEVLPINSLLLATQSAGPMGSRNDRLFQFLLNGNADSYEFRATAAGSSLSLDRIAVDTHFSTPIPPTAVAAIAFAGIGGLVRLRRGVKGVRA